MHLVIFTWCRSSEYEILKCTYVDTFYQCIRVYQGVMYIAECVRRNEVPRRKVTVYEVYDPVIRYVN